jgi:predicted DNA-binding mobile mystery protein A
MKDLQILQLNERMLAYTGLQKIAKPSIGWIKAIRTTIGMSLEQLGNKLSITKQSVRAIEKREADGAITIRSMQEVAKALDMQFVYAFVPMDGSLEALIDRKANELARKIVMRTSQSMRLEGQENTEQRIKAAIQERVANIKSEMPKSLWD